MKVELLLEAYFLSFDSMLHKLQVGPLLFHLLAGPGFRGHIYAQKLRNEEPFVLWQ